MADFGYGGIGSGLDISSIVNQLVAADRKPADNALNLQQSKTKMQLSSLGTVTSAFDKLKTALTALKATTAFDTRTVTASGKAQPGNTEDVLTASVALYDLGTSKAAAANGTHKVEVKNLASAHKLIADTSVPKTDTFGAGTLTLTVGVGDKAKTMNVQVEEGDTLTTVRNKIDAAGRKEGVQATLISSGDNQYLSIAQEKTGAASAIKLEYAGSDPKLGALVGSLKENSPAKDALLTIDGVEVVSASNTVTDAVPGLTLNLKVPGLSTVVISTDTTAATKVMQEFVTAYNAAVAAINTETKYDPKTKEAAALTGDAQMRGAIAQLRSTMSGVLKDLAGDQLDAKALGLQTRGYPNADGTLVLDSTKFAAALAAQPEKIRQAVTGDTGGAGRLYSLVDGYVSTTVGKEGAFVARTKGLNTTLDNIDKRRKDLDARMVGVEAQLQEAVRGIGQPDGQAAAEQHRAAAAAGPVEPLRKHARRSSLAPYAPITDATAIIAVPASTVPSTAPRHPAQGRITNVRFQPSVRRAIPPGGCDQCGRRCRSAQTGGAAAVWRAGARAPCTGHPRPGRPGRQGQGDRRSMRDRRPPQRLAGP